MNWFRIALSLLVVVGGAAALLLYSGGLSSPIRLSEARGTIHHMDGAKAVAISLSITNEGGPDRILFATSPDAKLAVFHGVTDLEGAPVPGTGAASLSLDGAHIMLMGVSGVWLDGRLIPLTITFQNAGEVTTKATLSAAVGGMDMSGQGMHHSMDHSNGMMIDTDVAPTITVTAAPVGDGWRIRAETERFTFAPAAMDSAHVLGEGHGHLYIGGLKIMRMTAPEAAIGALPPGRHKVRVTLNTNNHMAYRTITGTGLVTATTFIDIPK
jgi:copper(I)-binding protein